MGVWMRRRGLWVRTGVTASAWSLVLCAGVGLSGPVNAAASTSTPPTRSAVVVDEPKSEPKAEPTTEPGTPAQPATGSPTGTNKAPVNEPVIDVKKQAQKPRPGQVMPGDGASPTPAKPATVTAPATPAQPSSPMTPTTPKAPAAPTAKASTAEATPPAQPVQPAASTTSGRTPSRQPVGDVPRLRPIVVNRPGGANAPAPTATSTAAPSAPSPATQEQPTPASAAGTPRAELAMPEVQPPAAIESMKPIERITPESIERPAPVKSQPVVEPTTVVPAKVEKPQHSSAEPAAPVTSSEKSQASGTPELLRMQPVEPAKPIETVQPVEPAKIAEPKAVESPVSTGGDSPLQRVRESVVVSSVSLTVESHSGLVQWRSVEAKAAGDEGWATMSVGEVIAGQVELRTGPLSEVTLRSGEGEVITLRRLSRVRVYRLQAPSDEAGVRAPSRLTAELSRGRMTATPAPMVAAAQANAPVRRNAVSVLVDGSLVLVREATEIGIDARGLSVRNVEADAPAGMSR